MTVRFVTFDEVRERFHGKRVAVVGSGPSVLDNEPGVVDGHEVVVRVQDYKTGEKQGRRCDVHYSFYGTSVRKSADTLIRDGCTLCMCKLPNSQPIESAWHRERGKLAGIDYRYIYQNRANWWPCDVFIPDDARFLRKFELLGKHQPTTGFAAILDVLECEPSELLLTGFDFFTSKIRNVDEPWREKNIGDPICHRPDLEAQWLAENQRDYPLRFDKKLTEMMAYMEPA